MVELALDSVFRALADPTRRAMLRSLASGEQNIGQLASPFSMSFAAASKHVKVLESAGLLRRRIEGRTHVCSIEPTPLAAADDWLRFYERFWRDQFSALDEVLRAETRRPLAPIREGRMTTLETLRISYRFAASAERVFDAWLDPATAARWLFTTPASESHNTEIDARVGGKWKITDRRGGVDYTALGEYVEIDRPRRLVFSFGMPQFAPGFSNVIVEIAEDGDGCVLTLSQENLPTEAIKPTEEGWAEMFRALAVVLKAIARA